MVHLRPCRFMLTKILRGTYGRVNGTWPPKVDRNRTQSTSGISIAAATLIPPCGRELPAFRDASGHPVGVG
jgi:hypothetical protein